MFMLKLRDKIKSNLELLSVEEYDECTVKALLMLTYGSTFQSPETMRAARCIRLSGIIGKLDLNSED